MSFDLTTLNTLIQVGDVALLAGLLDQLGGLQREEECREVQLDQLHDRIGDLILEIHQLKREIVEKVEGRMPIVARTSRFEDDDKPD